MPASRAGARFGKGFAESICRLSSKGSGDQSGDHSDELDGVVSVSVQGDVEEACPCSVMVLFDVVPGMNHPSSPRDEDMISVETR